MSTQVVGVIVSPADARARVIVDGDARGLAGTVVLAAVDRRQTEHLQSTDRMRVGACDERWSAARCCC